MHRENYLNSKFVNLLHNRYFSPKKMNAISTENVAILGIDLQKFFLKSSCPAYLPSAPFFIDILKNFYTFVKERGIKIILTRHWHEENIMERWWSSTMPRAASTTQILEELEAYGDAIIEKNTYDAFYQTNLEYLLKDMEIETVIITGVMTHLCCETTAREAFVRGFNVILPIDGTLTQNAELHEGTVRAISHGFAPTPTLKDVIEWMCR